MENEKNEGAVARDEAITSKAEQTGLLRRKELKEKLNRLQLGCVLIYQSQASILSIFN